MKPGVKPADLRGQRFGLLTAVERTGERSHRSVVWACRCECGNTAHAVAGKLTSGRATHCGCRHGDANKYETWRIAKALGISVREVLRTERAALAKLRAALREWAE